jgi:hypothetical protein
MQHIEQSVLLDIDQEGSVVESGFVLPIRVEASEIGEEIEGCEGEDVGVTGTIMYDEHPVLIVTRIDELSDVRRFVHSASE